MKLHITLENQQELSKKLIEISEVSSESKKCFKKYNVLLGCYDLKVIA